jgi:hypothetical protein
MLRFLIEWIIYQKTMIRKIENEKIFLMRKIDEVKHEIFQLENNIQFLRIREMRRKKNCFFRRKKHCYS